MRLGLRHSSLIFVFALGASVFAVGALVFLTLRPKLEALRLIGLPSRQKTLSLHSNCARTFGRWPKVAPPTIPKLQGSRFTLVVACSQASRVIECLGTARPASRRTRRFQGELGVCGPRRSRSASVSSVATAGGGRYAAPAWTTTGHMPPVDERKGVRYQGVFVNIESGIF